MRSNVYKISSWQKKSNKNNSDRTHCTEICYVMYICVVCVSARFLLCLLHAFNRHSITFSVYMVLPSTLRLFPFFHCFSLLSWKTRTKSTLWCIYVCVLYACILCTYHAYGWRYDVLPKLNPELKTILSVDFISFLFWKNNQHEC